MAGLSGMQQPVIRTVAEGMHTVGISLFWYNFLGASHSGSDYESPLHGPRGVKTHKVSRYLLVAFRCGVARIDSIGVDHPSRNISPSSEYRSGWLFEHDPRPDALDEFA